MNGRGGEKGVELNFPQNVTEYLPQDYLRKWILDPTQFRYNSRMPKLGSETEKPEVMVDSILTYLKWMASHKQQPN